MSFLVRIQSECGKIRTRKTPNTDTFHAVVIALTNFSDGKTSSSTTLNSATLKRLFKRGEKNERDLEREKKEKEEKKKRKEWKKFNVSFSLLI